MKKYLLLGALLASQAAAIDTDQQGSWYGFYYDADFANSQWGLTGDWQYRLWDTEGKDLQTTLIRNGLQYRVNDDLAVAGGYVHLTRGPFGIEQIDKTLEHRTYQQVSYWQVRGNFRVQHRVRTEQRWRESRDFAQRYRYNLLLQYDLTDNVYLTGYNEYFIDGDAHFDQNRTKAAIGIKLNEDNALHFGYMHQIDNNFEKGQFMASWYHKF